MSMKVVLGYIVALGGLGQAFPCNADIDGLKGHGKIGYSNESPHFEYGAGLSYKGIMFSGFERPNLSKGYEFGYFHAFNKMFVPRLNNGIYATYGFERYESPAKSIKSYFIEGPEKFTAKYFRVGAVLFDFVDLSVRQINRDIDQPVIYDRGNSKLEKTAIGYFIGLSMVISHKSKN